MKISIRNIILLCWLLLYSFTAYPQNKTIDSLQKVLASKNGDTNKVNTLLILSREFYSISDLRNSMVYIKESLSLAEKINFDRGKAAGYRAIGELYEYQSDYTNALESVSKALVIYQKTGDKIEAANCYTNLGKVNDERGNYPEALKNDYSALQLQEESGDKKDIAYILSLIGNEYSSQNNYPEALKNYFASVRISKEIGDSSSRSLKSSYSGIAFIDMAQGDYSGAIKFDSLDLKISNESGDKWSIGWSYLGFGDLYQKLGDFYKTKDIITANNYYTEARKNYLAALKSVQESTVNPNAFGFFNQKLGVINTRLHNLAEAKGYLLKSLQLTKKSGFTDELQDVYKALAELDSAQGNFPKAFADYKMYIIYRDSVNNNETAKKSLQLKMQYDTDKKEAIAKAIQDKKDAEVKRVRNLQYFAIASLAVLVLVIVLVAFIQWRNNKQKQKANILLQQQKEKVESTLTELKSTQSQLIQSEKMASLGELIAGIAHEIQNPLNFVNNFSDVNTELIDELEQEMNKGNIEEAKAIAKDIKENEQKINHHGKRADSIVKGMLQHSKKSTGQKEPTDINALADEYLRLSFHGMRAKDKSFSEGMPMANATLKIDFDKSIGLLNIIPQDISRVLLNLYNNAFYAVNEKAKQQPNGYDPTILVSTKRSVPSPSERGWGEAIILTVTDNGNGIPQNIVDKIFQPFFTTKPTGEGTGLGLSLSYDIIKAHGGEIKVESKEGEGTEFIIMLPM